LSRRRHLAGARGALGGPSARPPSAPRGGRMV